MFPTTVVVPLDGSQFATKAISVACAILHRPGGRVLLVTTPWDGDVSGPRDYLADIAAGFSGLKVETLVVEDQDAAAAITLAARQAPGHVVCMTSHGRGRVRWAFLGSVAEQVVSESHDPVVLLGRECETEWPHGLRRMLVCVDGSTARPPVLPVALEWARELNLDLHLAAVIHPLDTVSTEADLKRLADEIEAGGQPVRYSVERSSYPAGALADLATSLDIGLVAMDSHARTGLARVAVGSVTMGVVGMARCPVLVGRAP